MPCTAALTLARTYSLIKIVGTGKRSPLGVTRRTLPNIR